MFVHKLKCWSLLHECSKPNTLLLKVLNLLNWIPFTNLKMQEISWRTVWICIKLRWVKRRMLSNRDIWLCRINILVFEKSMFCDGRSSFFVWLIMHFWKCRDLVGILSRMLDLFKFWRENYISKGDYWVRASLLVLSKLIASVRSKRILSIFIEIRRSLLFYKKRSSPIWWRYFANSNWTQR